MNYGGKIAELRKKNGMTQDDLGKAMNVSYQAVSKWERDESQPDFDTMSRIAKFFNVPLGYFAENGEETETAKQEEPKAEPVKTENTEKPEETTAEPAEATVGVCTVCGKMLTESKVSTHSPKLVCKECAEREQRIQAENKENEEREEKLENELSARAIIGHGFDIPLIVSLVLALIGYAALAALNFLNLSSDDIFLYGALLFVCPLALFGCTHAFVDFINDWKEREDDAAYKCTLSLIVGAGFAVLNAVLFLVLYLVSDSEVGFYFLILLGVGTVISFTFVSQFLWGGVVKDMFTAGGFTFKLPGFIITLDIDSIVWMIVAKIFLGILAVIVFIVTTIVLAVVAILGSLFLFIPAIIWKTMKDKKAKQRLKKS